LRSGRKVDNRLDKIVDNCAEGLKVVRMFNELIATAITGIDLLVVAVFMLALFITGVGAGMVISAILEEMK